MDCNWNKIWDNSMIITEEFLNAIKCCKDGIAFGHHLNLVGKDHEFVLNYFKDNGHTHPHDWLKKMLVSYEAIIYRGNYKVNGYHIFNPLTGLYEIAENENEAKLLKSRIIADYVNSNVEPLIDIKKELIEPDGTSVLINHTLD